MSKKKILAGVCAAVVALSSIPVATAEAAKATTTKPMKLYMWGFMDKVQKQSYVRDEINKKFNVEIEYIPAPAVSWKETIGLKIAAGEMYDHVKDVTIQDYFSYIDQDIIAEVPRDFIQKNAPRLHSWFEENATGGEKAWKYYEYDGDNYAVPSVWTLGKSNATLGIREDFLRAAGVTKIPETITEFETALKKIKETKKIAPLSGANGFHSFDFVFGAYGVYPNIFTEKDGKITLGLTDIATRDVLTLLNKWYKDGLIDKEFIINKGKNVEDKWNNGKVAVAQSSWWDFIPKDAFFSGVYYDTVMSTDKNAKVSVILPPKGPNGERGTIQNGTTYGNAMLFGKHMEKDKAKMAKYLEVFDYAFDRDMMDLITLGVEGKTYTYDEVTGYKFIAPYDKEDERIKMGIGSNIHGLPGAFNDYDLQAKYMTLPKYVNIRNQSEKKGIGKFNLLAPTYRETFAQKSEQLDKIVATYFIDFITGAKPISQFEKFVKEWNAAGGTAVLKEAQQTYDKLFKK